MINQVTVARLAKVSKAAVTYAVKSSRLRHVEGTKKINLHDPLTQNFIELSLQKGAGRGSNYQPKPEKIKKKSEKLDIKVNESEQEINKSDLKYESYKPDKNSDPDNPPDDDTLSPDSPSAAIRKLYWDIEKQKESALKSKQERERSRGILIKRDMVRRVFAKIYTIDSNELKPLGDKLAPEIAAIFESDDAKLILKTKQKLEKEIFRSLKHIKRLINDFLKSLEAEPIE